jgi:hypothetical protein
MINQIQQGGIIWPGVIPCNSSNPCNKISNGGLDSAAYSVNTNNIAVGGNHIYCWKASHGNPFTSASDRNNIPTTIDWAQYNHDLVMDATPNNTGDGVFQSGLNIQSGRIYFLKFFYSVSNCAFVPSYGYLDNDPDFIPAQTDSFFIKFANGLTNVATTNHQAVPNITQFQTLGQLTNLASSQNPQWIETTLCIKANSNYDALWFYPQQNGSSITRIRIRNIRLYEADAGGPTLNVPCSGSGFFHLGQGCANIPGATYSWSPTTGLSNPNSLNPTVNFSSFSGSRTYTLTVSMGGCSVSDSVTLIQQRPAISLQQQIEICSSNDLPVLLISSPDYSGTPGYGFQWYIWDTNTSQFIIIPGATQQNYSAPAPGVYVLVVTHFATACQNSTFCYVYLAPQNTANTDFGIYSVAQPGLPYFTALVNPANTNWNGLQHGYWISEVDQSFNNPVLVNPPIWGTSGFQWLTNTIIGDPLNGQPFRFQRNRYYEIKHGIWNKCKDWKETRHYIYIN